MKKYKYENARKTQEFSKSSCVFLQKEIEWKTEKKTFTFYMDTC